MGGEVCAAAAARGGGSTNGCAHEDHAWHHRLGPSPPPCATPCPARTSRWPQVPLRATSPRVLHASVLETARHSTPCVTLPSVDPHALARVVGSPAHPRRCPDPFPDGAGPAPRGLGGRRGDRRESAE